MPDTKKWMAFILAIVFSASIMACQSTEIDNNPTTENKDKTTEEIKSSVVSTLGETTTTVTENNDNETETSSSNNTDGSYKIERTTNKDGNASDDFIKSLEGFELKILYPWKNTYANKKCKKYAETAKKNVQELYGVKIQEKSRYNNYDESLASEMAAKNCKHHIYYAKNTMFTDYFKSGYFANLIPAMRESGVDLREPWYVSEATDFLNIDGKQLGWISSEEDFTMPYFIIYNKKLLNKKGLESPESLAQQGQWTWDKLREYAGKFYSDKNVSGFVGGGINMLAAVAQQFDTQLTKIDKGTQPTTNLNDANFADALSTYYDWTYGGSFWCETFNGKKDSYAIKQFEKGKVAMLYGNYDDIKALKGKSVTKNIGVAPFPTKEESSGYTNIAEPEYVAFIPSVHQEQASKILFLRNEYYRYNYSYSLKSLTSSLKTYLGDNEQTVTNIINIKLNKDGNNTDYCWTKFCEDVDAGITTEEIVNQIENGTYTSTEAISKNKNALTEAYANIWKRHRITGNV